MCSQCEDSQWDEDEDEDEDSPNYDRWEEFADWLEHLSEYQRAQFADVTEPSDYSTEIMQALENLADSVAELVRDHLRDGEYTPFEFQRYVDNNGVVRDYADDAMLWEADAVKAIFDIGELDGANILQSVRAGQTIVEACVSRLTEIFTGYVRRLVSLTVDYSEHWDTERLTRRL